MGSERGGGSTSWFTGPSPAGAAPGRPAPEAVEPITDATSQSVLVVDDTPISRRLALGVLAKLGYAADAVTSGRQALEALTHGAYAAVLMDCQMPEMDGFAATAEVRRLPGAAGRTPIIAVTASAMPGERERCLAAGMNDYIAKPFRVEELAAVLQRWAPRARDVEAPVPATDEQTPAGGAETPVLDAAAFASLGGSDSGDSATLRREVARLFLEDTPRRLAALQDALAAADPAALASTAHALKGEASLIGAREVAALARELELQARMGQPHGSELMVARLAAACERACAAVARAASAEGPEEPAR
ncbi:MAG TPA: response regulator [Chloroflexota bacterium]|nr:response regulator [Chloroflexota bacterium]